MVWPFVLISAILFLVGAALGSFLNVVIYRTVRDESWVYGRSHCEHCMKQIHWYDNIPVVSFLILRARCRHCREPLSFSHPVVETLTGIMLVWWYWAGSFFFQLTQRPFQTLQPLFWLFVGLLLVAIFFADLLYYLIPDLLVGLLLGLTILYRVVLVSFGIMQVGDLVLAVVGLVLSVAFFGALWLFTRGKGMGLGDVKLVAPLALLVGWPMIGVMLVVAFTSGAVVGLVMLALKRKKLGQVIPFGPFLVGATLVTLIMGDYLLQWYLSWL